MLSNAKIWKLRWLKALGASRRILRLIYFQHTKSILEFGSPAWSSALINTEREKIQHVQKVALRLIYGWNNSYKKLLSLSNLSTLALIKEKLSPQFWKKAAKHPKFKQWFKVTNPDQPSERAHYAPIFSRNKKLLKTPISYFIKLLNTNNGN